MGGCVLVHSGATFEFFNARIENCYAHAYGGGLRVESSTLVIGGAILAHLSVIGPAPSWAQPTVGGGAMDIVSSTAYITDTLFTNNNASTDSATFVSGGALTVSNNAVVNIRGVTFDNVGTWSRTVNANGGALSVKRSVVSLDNCTLLNTFAMAKSGNAEGGSIILKDYPQVEIRRSRFLGTSAIGNGFGVGGAIIAGA